jgi:hypothetical protein
MVKYLYRKCYESKWLEPTEDDFGLSDGGASNLGVVLRRSDGMFTADPLFLNSELVKAVERLGVPVAFTMSSDIVQTLLSSVTPFQTEISLDPRGFVLPIVNSVKELASPKSSVTKEAYICLCRSEKYVLVWSDSVQGVLAHGSDVETRLLGLVSAPLPVNSVLSYPVTDDFSSDLGLSNHDSAGKWKPQPRSCVDDTRHNSRLDHAR